MIRRSSPERTGRMSTDLVNLPETEFRTSRRHGRETDQKYCDRSHLLFGGLRGFHAPETGGKVGRFRRGTQRSERRIRLRDPFQRVRERSRRHFEQRRWCSADQAQVRLGKFDIESSDLFGGNPSFGRWCAGIWCSCCNSSSNGCPAICLGSPGVRCSGNGCSSVCGVQRFGSPGVRCSDDGCSSVCGVQEFRSSGVHCRFFATSVASTCRNGRTGSGLWKSGYGSFHSDPPIAEADAANSRCTSGSGCSC